MKTLSIHSILIFFAMTASTAIFSSCGNNSFSAQIGVNHADTIYLGDLREKFKGDSLFFQVVAPDLMLIQNQYTWLATVKEAEKKGLDEKYYKKVQLEINRTNEAIRKGIMKGANAKRIYDFQKEFE